MVVGLKSSFVSTDKETAHDCNEEDLLFWLGSNQFESSGYTRLYSQ